MKKIIPILFIILALGCSEDSANQNNSNLVDVYVTGQKNGNPCYWKNNQLVELDNGGIPSIIATKIIISGNDVHVFGSNGGSYPHMGYFYWKNGVFHDLNTELDINNEGAVIVNDMFVDGTDVYFCGNFHYANTVCYWKNGVKTTLSSNDGGSASYIVVSDNSVFVSASKFPFPITSPYYDKGYYIDGVFFNETEYCGINGMIKINDDVHIYGTKDNISNGANYKGFYKNLITNVTTFSSNAETILNLHEDNGNLFFNDNYKTYKNDVVIPYFNSGHILITFKVLDNNSYALSLTENETGSNATYYLEINNTNEMQINYDEGRFTSILVVQN